ncbi:MAG TPA: o-succinylbenzoate synthase [Acidimicrobiales bacterium]|nr:o-succinylbenzoate synthase [Acidimicrobiales bacterium]
MRLEALELRLLRLPLVTPFRTAAGVQSDREVLLLRAVTSVGDGWSECAALAEPTYTAEYVDGARDVIVRHLLPLLAAVELRGGDVASLLAPVKGHRMAKCALELAVLDAELRSAEQSLASFLGATRDAVDPGVSVGMSSTTDELLEQVAAYVDAGYRRVKLKIAPRHDIEPLRAVREAFGDALLLQADANGAYADDVDAAAAALAALDDLELLLIEQPLGDDDLTGHAELARRIATPICLDESIESLGDLDTALALGACSVVNLKPGRVGGYVEAVRIHDRCVDEGVGLWCGGMLESGIGRAANLALAALPGFTLPPDLSASDRYYRLDVTPPFVLDGGRLHVPKGAGIGVTPDPSALEELTISTEVVQVQA